MARTNNPWAPGGKYWVNNALKKNVLTYIHGTPDKPTSHTEDKTVYVNNESNKIVYYKSETGSDAIPVMPKSKSYEPIDGVVTHRHCNKVYKVFTGATVDIDEDGNVDPDYSGVGDFVNFIAGGGWKDEKWLQERHTQNPPDKGWDALFKVSKTICKQ
jgi:hypothetical protein